MQQILVFATLAATLGLLAWGKFRYEAVALCALLVLVVAGVIPAQDAFLGFSNPAVVTVAAILVITRGLANAGVADWLAGPLSRTGRSTVAQLLVLTTLVAVLSAFINNVGALALMMPVALQLARSHKQPPSLLLMPMAFASLLGGLMTSIGTPANLIVAEFSGRDGVRPFALFDFSHVGIPIAVAGTAFLVLFGWRLLPRRRGGDDEELAFTLSGYLTEVRVPKDASLAGITLAELERKLGPDVVLVGLVRGDERISARRGRVKVSGGDVLVVRGRAEPLKTVVHKLQLELAGRGEAAAALADSADLHLAEAVVLVDALCVGRSARSLDLRGRHATNLLAISRQGSAITRSLSDVLWRPGDVLLLEGGRARLGEVLSELGCLPLAARKLGLGRPRRLLAAVALLASAVVAAAAGLAPIQVTLVLCAVAMAGAGMVSAREAYRSVDWSVIVLLAAMIPMGHALEVSGGAAWLARNIAEFGAGAPPLASLVLVLVATMFLSDVINNAAAAVLMCPIAAGVAAGLQVSADPFLMAVAIGASCAFLTPIGHQSNTLVLGPGGYRFGDYWRVGLPVEVIVGIVAVVLIPVAWPF